jgi:Zn finger protein HypA/HybF involved in hydrogenase expression
VNQTNEIVTQELTVTVPRLLAAVEKGKPDGVKDPIRVSLLLGTPEVMKQYEQYARSQSQLVRKCPVCGEPATWFAFPCSHALYCDECKELDEAANQLPIVCPACGAEITKLVRAALSE